MDVHFRKKGVVKSSHEFLTHFELEMVFKSIVPTHKGFNASQRKLWAAHAKAVMDGGIS